MKQAPQNTSGFVLLNALILVAVMSAVAVLLLSRAETSRIRLEADQAGRILTQNLDAFEAWAKILLNADQDRGPIDHLTEAWARPSNTFDLDVGAVTGQLRDQQALFNVNWFADPEFDHAREAFKELLQDNGLSTGIVDLIVSFVSAEGPKNKALFQTTSPPTRPIAGPILMVDQLRLIPELSEQEARTLAPLITALPVGTRLNLNTASPQILAAMIPQMRSADITAAVVERAQTPFQSVQAFAERYKISFDREADPDAMDPNRFSVATNWFRADILAEYGERTARRTVLLGRDGTGTFVEWRVSYFGGPQGAN